MEGGSQYHVTAGPCSNNNNNNNEDGNYHGVLQLPPGFRFHPTDEEIIMHYLLKKVMDRHFTALAIAEADLNKCEPWDLPYKAKMGEKEWFFFCQRDRKYPTGMRTNRATDSGYWKATGKDKEIFYKNMRGNNNTAMRNSCLVGMKKTLVFYKGRAPKGEKTNWVMHEYRLEGDYLSSNYNLSRTEKDQWVVCRVIHKNDVGIKRTQTGIELARIDSFINHLLDDDNSPTLPPLKDFSNSSHDHHHHQPEPDKGHMNNIPSSSTPLFNNPKPEILMQQYDHGQKPFVYPTHYTNHINPILYSHIVHENFAFPPHQSPVMYDQYHNQYPFKNAYNQGNFRFLQPPMNNISSTSHTSMISHSQDTGVSELHGIGANSEITSGRSITDESKNKTTVRDQELEGLSFSPDMSELDSILSYRDH